MKPRFLLDEHINRSIQRQLRRMNLDIDVLAIGDLAAPPLGTSDLEILVWLEEHNYILVTENRSTIPVHLSDHYAEGRHIPGILWVRPNIGIGRLIKALYLIWAASEAEEYYDRAIFIPL